MRGLYFVEPIRLGWPYLFSAPGCVSKIIHAQPLFAGSVRSGMGITGAPDRDQGGFISVVIPIATDIDGKTVPRPNA